MQAVVAFAPGGPGDTLARTLAPVLSERWGVRVVVDNKPGAGGAIAAAAVLREPADGHVLLFTSTTHVQAIGLNLRLAYDPIADFLAIARLAVVPLVLMVREDGPRTLEEFVALARRGDASYASFGAASTGHIYGELLNRIAGLPVVNVPFGGGAPAVASLMAGQTTASFVEGTQAIPLARSGRLRPLAATGPTRFVQLPDVPTFLEEGYPGFELRGFHGVLARAGTPADVAARISADVGAALEDPAVAARFASLGVERSPARGDWNAALPTEAAEWTDLIRRTGVSVQ